MEKDESIMDDNRARENKNKYLNELRHLRRRIPKMKEEDWLINFTQLARMFYSEGLELKGEFSYKDVEERLKERGFSTEIIRQIKEFNDELFNLQFAPTKERPSLEMLCDRLKRIIEWFTAEYIEIYRNKIKKKGNISKKHPIKRFLDGLREKREQQLILKIRRLMIKAYGHLEKNEVKEAAKCYNEIAKLFEKTKEEHYKLKREIRELYEEIIT